MNKLKEIHKISNQKYNLKQNISNIRNSNKILINKYIKEDTKLILQIGTFVGSTTHYILKKFNKTIIISIDTWDTNMETITRIKDILKMQQYQSDEINLYDQFITNLWEYKDRIIPLKMDTTKVFEYLKTYNINPDIIYFDMDYGYEYTIQDLNNIHKYYPNIIILGDDIKMIDGVYKATHEFFESNWNKYNLEIVRNAYALVPKKFKINTNSDGTIFNKIKPNNISTKPLLIVVFFPNSKLGKRHAVKWYKKFKKIRKNIKVKNYIYVLFEPEQIINIEHITKIGSKLFNSNDFNIIFNSNNSIPNDELIKYYSCEPTNPIFYLFHRNINMVLISFKQFIKIKLYLYKNLFREIDKQLIYILSNIIIDLPSTGKMNQIFFWNIWGKKNIDYKIKNYNIYKQIKWKDDYFNFIKN